MKTIRVNLPYALYCASILVGAGVLTLPLIGPRLGFGPLLTLIVLEGLWLLVIYRRMARTIFASVLDLAHQKTVLIQQTAARGAGIETDRPQWQMFFMQKAVNAEARKGAAIFDHLMDSTGIGQAGRVSLLLGTFFYVFFADIGYLLVGNRSLNALAQMAGKTNFPVVPLFIALGSTLVVVSFVFSRLIRSVSALTASVQKFGMMLGWWVLAIGILSVLDREHILLGSATTGSVVATGLFFCAIVSAMYTGVEPIDRKDHHNGLSAQHRVNMLIMIIEFGLIGLTAILTLWIFSRSGMLRMFPFTTEDWLSLSSLDKWSRVLGVVLFAYVGTGIFNMAIYPELFDGTGESKVSFTTVMALGTFVPMVLYLGWTLVGAVTLAPETLLRADANNEPTHIVIATTIATFAPQTAWVIICTGYLFALMAVTSACNGFTESLADRIRIAFPHSAQWSAPFADWRPVILMMAAVMALARDVFSASIDISAILAIAGNAGGGLLILILPLFFPYPLGQRMYARYVEIAIAVITALILMIAIITEPMPTTAVGSVMTWIKFAVASVVLVMTIWLLLSEPRQELSSLQGRHKDINLSSF